MFSLQHANFQVRRKEHQERMWYFNEQDNLQPWRITFKNQGTYKLSLYCCPIFKILTSQTFFAKPSVKLTINHDNQPENWTFYFKLIWFWTEITYDKFYFFISLFSRLCDCILTIIRTWYWANITTMLISLVMKIQIFMEASI